MSSANSPGESWFLEIRKREKDVLKRISAGFDEVDIETVVAAIRKLRKWF